MHKIRIIPVTKPREERSRIQQVPLIMTRGELENAWLRDQVSTKTLLEMTGHDQKVIDEMREQMRNAAINVVRESEATAWGAREHDRNRFSKCLMDNQQHVGLALLQMFKSDAVFLVYDSTDTPDWRILFYVRNLDVKYMQDTAANLRLAPFVVVTRASNPKGEVTPVLLGNNWSGLEHHSLTANDIPRDQMEEVCIRFNIPIVERIKNEVL